MNFKSLIAATAMIAAASTNFAAAATVVTLSPTGSASFSGAAASNTFTLDLSSLTGTSNVTSVLSANFAGNSGYDITSATFDGASFTALVNYSVTGLVGADVWQFNFNNVSSSLHTIVVNGAALGGSTAGFTGSLSVTNSPLVTITPVPEPETYAMLLAGLGLMGAIARRRNKSKSV
jgi:hypothetical protein